MAKEDVLGEAVEMLIRKVLEQSVQKSAGAVSVSGNSLKGEKVDGLSSATGTSK
ncbi:hypothetical protein CLHUN_00060 [Ruminiclostridium hungatei]|uniref:Uncharacterized protein n=1 Tax=Ruminiclostridium hungatei TaxID=48256 RepID=A0A1V4SQR0_RUMHU|nr:hypothetical protein [Ruminiclostridium hungatei]OPX46190.1 hypothetical protein CLHUN_00060 [Ruminiclostridium hungatei]